MIKMIDTESLKSQSFRKLSTKNKSIFLYMLIHSCSSGVVQIDLEMMSAWVGDEVTINDIELVGKFEIYDTIAFDRSIVENSTKKLLSELSVMNNAEIAHMRTLVKYGIVNYEYDIEVERRKFMSDKKWYKEAVKMYDYVYSKDGVEGSMPPNSHSYTSTNKNSNSSVNTPKNGNIEQPRPQVQISEQPQGNSMLEEVLPQVAQPFDDSLGDLLNDDTPRSNEEFNSHTKPSDNDISVNDVGMQRQQPISISTMPTKEHQASGLTPEMIARAQAKKEANDNKSGFVTPKNQYGRVSGEGSIPQKAGGLL